MPTPEYITELRRHHGHELLLLPGVSGVVLHPDTGAVLLGRRSDNGEWQLPSGIVEPGEQPATTLLRELWEETRVSARIDRLALLKMEPENVYPNGDRCQFVSMVFRCTWTGGQPTVGDEESTEVGWFTLDDLPPVTERTHERIRLGLPPAGETVYFL